MLLSVSILCVSCSTPCAESFVPALRGGLGHLLALHMTPASEQGRDQVERLAHHVQEVTEQSMELAYVDQGYTGELTAEAAEVHGIALEVVKLPEAKEALYYYHVVGLSSAALVGGRDFGAWCEIM